MNSNSLLDALKKHLNIPSEYALAKALKVTPQGLREMRARGLSDERALQISVQIGMSAVDAMEVLAAIHAERAKNPEVKQAWDSIVRTLKRASAATVTGFFLTGLLGGYAPPSQAAQIGGNPVKTEHCILCQIIALLRSGGFWRGLSQFFTGSPRPLLA